MKFIFNDVELDLEKMELSRGQDLIDVEPKVFSLLCYLAENNERLITKDELIEKVWSGRVISENALSTGIKEARKAVGDTGSRQAFIKTVHGRGFRFVADVRRVSSRIAETEMTTDNDTVALLDTDVMAGASRSLSPPPDQIEPGHHGQLLSHLSDGQPSIAVLPFRFLSSDEEKRPLADAIPAELITALSKLRWLFVTARTSSFKFQQDNADVVTIRRNLGVNYCLSGVLECIGNLLTVSVELVDTRTGNVVWADRYAASIEDMHELRSQLVGGVISGLELHIPLNEAHLVKGTAIENLDAWSVFHLGLQHMYRFNKSDNAIAAELFRRALALDSGFARAHAGLSFTGFTDAFLSFDSHREKNIKIAAESAEQAINLDPMDPFANYNVGRSRWLVGDLDGSLPWLDRARQLSPNFAQGHYARSWVDTLSGRNEQSRANAELARKLSPLDPMYYAMLGTTALSYIAEENAADAVYFGERAARAPGAHYFISLIAAAAHSLAGDLDKAHEWRDKVITEQPNLTIDSFFRAFPYTDAKARKHITNLFNEISL